MCDYLRQASTIAVQAFGGEICYRQSLVAEQTSFSFLPLVENISLIALTHMVDRKVVIPYAMLRKVLMIGLF